ncbi:MAG: RluA family pseudouridine synthase [Deltaproteobacteria bacterium]
MDFFHEIQQEEIFGQEFTISVDKKQTPLRIDKFLQNRLFNVTRNKIQAAIDNNIIKVNGEPVKANYKIRPNDVITGIIPKRHDFDAEIIGENIPLNIVYEDDELMVIDKPAGLVVHPGVSNYSGTLVNALKYYFDNKNLPVLDGNNNDRPGIVHRIDKNTSGLLLIAKTEDAMTKLAAQFFHHTIDRDYLALVWGNFNENVGTIDINIGRDPNFRKQMKAFPDNDEGKRAVTHYSVLEDLYYVSLIKCSLETGRTHQIRVHLKHTGHPVFNDDTYGGEKIVKGTIFSKYSQFVKNCFELLPGQALHAQTLGFVHPSSGEKMNFTSQLPPEFMQLLQKWRTYVNSRKKEI